jgi:hypothetical protein
LIWIYNHGPIPCGSQIDHKNGDRSDNRIENLRLATNAENADNRQCANQRSVTGIRNVYWEKGRGKYRVQIIHRGKHYCFGLFDCKKIAEIVAIEKRAELKGEFSGTNCAHAEAIESRPHSKV